MRDHEVVQYTGSLVLVQKKGSLKLGTAFRVCSGKVEDVITRPSALPITFVDKCDLIARTCYRLPFLIRGKAMTVREVSVSDGHGVNAQVTGHVWSVTANPD